jgi:hypothetical protein
MIKTTPAALLSSGVLAAATVLLTASLIAAPEATARLGDTIEYLVTSDGPLESVWYSDANEQIQYVKGPPANCSFPLPIQPTGCWSTTFKDTTETPSTYVVAAQGPDTQSPSCRISINGVFAMSSSGVGRVECHMVNA